MWMCCVGPVNELGYSSTRFEKDILEDLHDLRRLERSISVEGLSWRVLLAVKAQEKSCEIRLIPVEKSAEARPRSEHVEVCAPRSGGNLGAVERKVTTARTNAGRRSAFDEQHHEPLAIVIVCGGCGDGPTVRGEFCACQTKSLAAITRMKHCVASPDKTAGDIRGGKRTGYSDQCTSGETAGQLL